MRHRGAKLFRSVVLTLALTSSGSAFSQTKPAVRDLGAEPVRSVLWVGNSFFYYNNSMHNHVGAFSRGGSERAIRSISVTISGSGLDWHDVKGYFEPNRLGRYTVGQDNKLVLNPSGRQFDTAIFMDCSQCPVHPDLGPVFQRSAKNVADLARQNGTRPVFFMSWGYKDVPGMTERVAEEYVKAGNDNAALVIPAGLAFLRAMKARPELELYQPDKRHPTLAGTYLAAATVYLTLTGNPLESSTYHAGLEPETAAFLRTMARETVREFLNR